MNLQPDRATAILSVLDPRLRLRFGRPKFDLSVGVARCQNPLTHLGSVLHLLGEAFITPRITIVVGCSGPRVGLGPVRQLAD